MWTIKGLAILWSGKQPPWIFELGPGFFAVGIIGLGAAIGKQRGRAANVGVVLAYVSGVFWLVSLLVLILIPHTTPEESFGSGNAIVLVTFVTNLIALALVGIAVRQAGLLRGHWRSLPLAVALSTVPLIMRGGLLSQADLRLLELPIVVLGIGWILIGSLLWKLAPPRGM